MRGIHYGTTINDSAVRFTPAHAVNTRKQCQIRRRSQVHPRPRGEYADDRIQLLGQIRFTPAHAGNTPSRFFADWIAWVHPRSRGEYYILCNLYCIMVDSPPPMRGILSCYSHNSGYNRFTPAHAGNTVFISSKPTTV